jgi:uncharacterized protein YdaU (DUF1376 family)
MSKKKVTKTEEDIELEKFGSVLKGMGYTTPCEFVEMACTMSVLIKENLPQAQKMAQDFALHCGYILDQTGHTEKMKRLSEEYAAFAAKQQAENEKAKKVTTKAQDKAIAEATALTSAGGGIVPAKTPLNIDMSGLLTQAKKNTKVKDKKNAK